MAAKDGSNALWSIFGYLLSGMLLWGGIGFALDRWLDNEVFTFIGLFVGIIGAIYLLWLRFRNE